MARREIQSHSSTSRTHSIERSLVPIGLAAALPILVYVGVLGIALGQSTARAVLTLAGMAALALGLAAVLFLGRALEAPHAARERAMREENFRQAQQMEAVGRLAGGVAHDFNNLLMAIRLNLEVLAELDEESVAAPLVHQAMEAVDRAASLTQQWLAVGRQSLRPARRELAAVVANDHVAEPDASGRVSSA
jgi:signal transduction histidine kinase